MLNLICGHLIVMLPSLSSMALSFGVPYADGVRTGRQSAGKPSTSIPPALHAWYGNAVLVLLPVRDAAS